MKGWTRTRSLTVDLESVVREITDTLKTVIGDRYVGIGFGRLSRHKSSLEEVTKMNKIVVRTKEGGRNEIL